MERRFRILLSLITGAIIMIGFIFFTGFFQKYLHDQLVEQTLKDNKMFGETAIGLIQRLSTDTTFKEEVLNVCNNVKLPNSGYICASDEEGNLIAAPGWNDESSYNIYQSGAKYSTADRKSTLNFMEMNNGGVFEGYYEYDNGYSDIIVSMRINDKYRLNVHQNNHELEAVSGRFRNTILWIGALIGVLLSSLTYYLISKLVNGYETKLEGKNKKLKEQKRNITSSIEYASKIQEAMLPPMDQLPFDSDNVMVFYKPRDIVSGDFYWTHETSEKVFVAAVDCTGHGVPGAMMSMTGNNLLNQIVVANGIEEPAEILNHLDEEVSKFLRQDESGNQDGMDMSFCVLDKKTKVLSYACARNPIYLIQNNEVKDLKAQRKSIGGSVLHKDMKFNTKEIQLNSKDVIYMLSDGFQDQMNDDDQRYQRKKMRQTLLESSNKPFSAQPEYLLNEFNSWRQEVDQLDDILIFGFRV